jgi:hypothetical protein
MARAVFEGEIEPHHASSPKWHPVPDLFNNAMFRPEIFENRILQD